MALQKDEFTNQIVSQSREKDLVIYNLNGELLDYQNMLAKCIEQLDQQDFKMPRNLEELQSYMKEELAMMNETHTHEVAALRLKIK